MEGVALKGLKNLEVQGNERMSASRTSPVRLARLDRRERLAILFYLVPSLIFLMIFFFLPILIFLWHGFFSTHFTAQFYLKAFTEPVYLLVLLRTLWVCLLTGILCLVLGYPVAYLLATGPNLVRTIILALVLIPFWTNVLVRVFAWISLLGRHGIINSALMHSGLTQEPLPLLYNTFAVLVGLVHVTLPYMIFPCYAIMRNIPVSLVNAAENLGAPPWRAFVRIYFPLSMPGATAGFLLVFIITGGFFITPALMGGGSASGVLLSQVIEREISDSNNWSFAAALSGILLVVTVVLYLIYDHLTTSDGADEYA
jgi:ABC-type spermidine/putrescine transport system permease subunit I